LFVSISFPFHLIVRIYLFLIQSYPSCLFLSHLVSIIDSHSAQPEVGRYLGVLGTGPATAKYEHDIIGAEVGTGQLTMNNMLK
jgi:hypothetical protein